MRNCLIVLNPRNIPECMRSIEQLPIDKLYMKAFEEIDLCKPINDFIRNSDYDNYLVVANDVIVTNEALRCVNNLLEKYEAATGYCLVSQKDNFVNVTRGPLRQTYKDVPVMFDYDFYLKDEISFFQYPEFTSWFGGWAFTGFRRDIWLDIKFCVTPYGRQSDYAFCIKYNNIIMSHKDAYIKHLKENPNGFYDYNFLVGKKSPEIIYETYVSNGPNLEKRVVNKSSPHALLLL